MLAAAAGEHDAVWEPVAEDAVHEGAGELGFRVRLGVEVELCEAMEAEAEDLADPPAAGVEVAVGEEALPDKEDAAAAVKKGEDGAELEEVGVAEGVKGWVRDGEEALPVDDDDGDEADEGVDFLEEVGAIGDDLGEAAEAVLGDGGEVGGEGDGEAERGEVDEVDGGGLFGLEEEGDELWDGVGGGEVVVAEEPEIAAAGEREALEEVAVGAEVFGVADGAEGETALPEAGDDGGGGVGGGVVGDEEFDLVAELRELGEESVEEFGEEGGAVEGGDGDGEKGGARHARACGISGR